MSCLRPEELAAYLDAPLPCALADHLRGCPACSRVFDQLRQTMQAVEKLPEPTLPDYLWTGVAARLQPAPQRLYTRWWRAAAGIGIAVTLTLGIYRQLAPALPTAPAASMTYVTDHQLLSTQDTLADRASLGVMLVSGE